jgi:hypothetical protein
MESGSVRVLSALVALMVPESVFELVFEDDDPAGRLQGGAAVDHLPSPGGQTQLIAGVTTVPACGPERRDQFRLVESAQEVGRGAGDLRGATHRVGGEVLIVEQVMRWGHTGTSVTRAPAQKRRGPGLRVYYTIYRQLSRLVVSTPAAHFNGSRCEDRIRVTGDHLTFEETAVSTPRTRTAS